MGIVVAAFVALTLITICSLVYAIRAHRERAPHLSEHDPLTSLGSHHAFYNDFSRELSRAHRHGHPLTLALIDVDDFKTVNDLRGHQHGDHVLRRIASALRSGRSEDRAYRIGGDEFAMLFFETTEHDACIALSRLQHAASGISEVTVSVGLCQLAADFDQQDLYKRAEAALNSAKRSGRNTITRFSDIENSAKIFPSRKSAALIKLLKEEALQIAFQPIYRIDGSTLLGFEALARPEPALGFIGPQEVFDVAERMREVRDLDMVCMKKALAAAKRDLPEEALLFLNVSPETLGSTEFDPQEWIEMVIEAGIDLRRLVVEVTERRITDTEELVAHVAALQRNGVRIALDDAGSGYAGLELLGKLPLDFVKIDRAVIVHAMTEPGPRGVLTGIVAIARETTTHVIAEGIENEEQFDFIRSLPKDVLAGIGSVQGYFFGRPHIGPPVLSRT